MIYFNCASIDRTTSATRNPMAKPRLNALPTRSACVSRFQKSRYQISLNIAVTIAPRNALDEKNKDMRQREKTPTLRLDSHSPQRPGSLTEVPPRTAHRRFGMRKPASSGDGSSGKSGQRP